MLMDVALFKWDSLSLDFLPFCLQSSVVKMIDYDGHR